jgi:Ca2+-binding RTX toxin-like protein
MTNIQGENNIIIGGEGNDLLIGDNGNDFLNGNGGNDLILGYGGNDTLLGGDGVDTLKGDAGNDTLIGGKGDDQMYGGAGNDRLIWNNGDNSDLMRGGKGYDVVEVNDSTTAADEFVVQQQGTTAIFDRLNLIPFTLNIAEVEKMEIKATFGDDILTVKDLSQTDIKLLQFSGGEGNDLLDGEDTSTPLYGLGGAGNDTLIGGSGVDTLIGGDGNDVIEGEKGNDIMIGGAGNDQLEWDDGDGSDIISGNAGYDVVVVEGSLLQGDSFVLAQNGNKAIFNRINLGNFTLTVDTSEKFEVSGEGGNDLFTVKDLSQTDVKLVQFSGGEGNDTLDASASSTPIHANGGKGNDLLIGGSGIDTLKGDAGNDTLVGGKGDDKMYGGAGNDRLIWNNGDNSDLMRGGKGYDVVEVNDSTTAADEFVLQQQGTTAIFDRLNLIPFTLNIAEVEKMEINATFGDDILTVKDLSQTDVKLVQFSGGEGNDLLDAKETSTRIIAQGGDGNDTLIGGTNDDLLIGGAGSDLLIGGGGNDTLIGGNGLDRFGFDSNAAFNPVDIGANTISNFSQGQDRLVVDKTVFSNLTSNVGIGFSLDSEFEVVANDANVETSEALIVYSTGTGNLYYNQNGASAGLGQGGLFATITDIPTLTENDFTIQA